MSGAPGDALEGGCACRFVRYWMATRPLFVHCCHCTDIHIFTSTKQPWVVLPEDTPAVPEYHDRQRYWPKESLERREALLALIDRARSSAP